MKICHGKFGLVLLGSFFLLLLLPLSHAKAEETLIWTGTDIYENYYNPTTCYNGTLGGYTFVQYLRPFEYLVSNDTIDKITYKAPVGTVKFDLYDTTNSWELLYSSEELEIENDGDIAEWVFETVNYDNTHLLAIEFITDSSKLWQNYNTGAPNYSAPSLTYCAFASYNDHAWVSVYSGAYVEEPSTSILVFGYPNIWSNPSVFPFNGTKTYPIYYNVCSIFSDAERVVVQPFYSDGIYQPAYEIYDKSEIIGPLKCSGNYFLKDNRNLSDSGTVHFDLIAFDSSGTIIGSTTSNTITFEEEETPATFIDHTYDKTINIDLGNPGVNPDYGATSTRFYFNYDFSQVNYASTTVYLWDITQATTTGYYTTGPFSSTSTGIGYIDVPTPTQQLFKNYYFIAQIPGYKSIKSDMFSVNWDFWPTEVYYDCEEVEVDMAEICDGISSDLVCELKTAIYKGVNWAFYPKCKDLIKLTVAFDKFKAGFPFNIYFDLTDSIKEAVETSQTATSSNNFSIPFIRPTATSSEYYMLPVVASSSFVNLIGYENYMTYRTTLGFIYWLVVAVMIYFTIRK